MKPLVAIACVFALMSAREAWAASGVTESASGQFIILSPNELFPLRSPVSAADSHFVSLQPALLAVSCEHMKEALRGALGAGTGWRGKIYLNLHPARSSEDPVTIFAEKFSGDWIYRVDLPDTLDQDRFVRAIVQVLLLERANRNAGARSAEIPDWLAEGFAQQLIATSWMEILPSPPNENENGVNLIKRRVDLTDAPGQAGDAAGSRKLNPLTEVQATLLSTPPLTFEQLSWPADRQFSGDAGKVYRSCAQLFVNQLLRLKNGPMCFQAMLEELPRRYNWQFAFLSGFRQYFQTPLDVEKWWALQLVQFTGRDLTQTWTTEESWKKLDEILFSPAELRTKSNEIPLHTAVTLQTIIREVDATRQTQALQWRLANLDALRLRVSQNLVALVDEYRGVIRTYLQKGGASRPGFLFFRRSNAGSERLAEATVKQLDALDAKREEMRSRIATSADVAATLAPAVSH